MTTTSYSQSNTYVQCSQHWKLKYIDKWESPAEGASLPFGTAFDEGVTALLNKKDNYLDAFNAKWYATTNRKHQAIPIFDSPTIYYSNSDFDEHVLKPEDLVMMQKWLEELHLTKLSTDPVELMSILTKVKKNPYKSLMDNGLKYFNRACWLSLKRKGEILIEAFKEQFMPHVEEVYAVQKNAYLKDDVTGDAVMGYIDFILKYKGYDKPIIFDLKTSAKLYEQEQIDNTDQLTLYVAMEGHRYNTDMVGYAVCVKNIRKDTISICKTCKHTKTGRHQTCDYILQKPVDKNGEIVYVEERCNGEWDNKVKLVPEIQVLVEQKSEDQMRTALMDQANIIEAMKQQIVYKNTSKCKNWYGQQCIFYNLCHNNDPSGLRKKS